jgi:diguanylate cyclase (GGDEF)-like protein
MEAASEDELRGIRLLKDVELESVRGLISACPIRFLQAEEVLVKAGQENRTVYFILTGRVRVHLLSTEAEPVAFLGPGDSIGEMSVIDRRPTSAYIVASEPTRLLAMDEEVLWSLVNFSHAAARNLLIDLVARLRHADALLVEGVACQAGESDWPCHGTVDALTGLHNQQWLDRFLDRYIQRTVMGGPFHNLALVMIDIDYFKTFNDRYGRLYGNHVLIFVANTICDHLRPSEVVIRCGGDEFAVLLPDVDVYAARDIAQRIQREIMDAVPVMPDGKSIPHPTVSLGLAMLKPGQSAGEFIAAGRRALNRAKNSGRNCLSE